jgi:hypothetical protein
MIDVVLTGFDLCVCRREVSEGVGGRSARVRSASTRDPRANAGVEPAHGREKAALLAGRLAHDVSILFGVGRHFGSQPRVKVSMTIIRRATPRAWPGQHTQSVFGATSGYCWGSAAGGATLRSARAIAMLSARLVEAKSP